MINLTSMLSEGKLSRTQWLAVPDATVIDGAILGIWFDGMFRRTHSEDLFSLVGETASLDGVPYVLTENGILALVGRRCVLKVVPLGVYAETASNVRNMVLQGCETVVSTALDPIAGPAPGSALPGLSVRGATSGLPTADVDCTVFAYMTPKRLVVTQNTYAARYIANELSVTTVIRNPTINYNQSDTSAVWHSKDPSIVKDYAAAPHTAINAAGYGACSHKIESNQNPAPTYGNLLEPLGSEYRGTMPSTSRRVHLHTVNGRKYLYTFPAPLVEPSDPDPALKAIVTGDYVPLVAHDGHVLVTHEQITDPVIVPPTSGGVPPVITPPDEDCLP
jgi:hypothetical protein